MPHAHVVSYVHWKRFEILFTQNTLHPGNSIMSQVYVCRFLGSEIKYVHGAVVYAKMFLLHLLRFTVLLLLWVSEVTVELISFSFFPHQTSPGCTLSIPADSGGRGTNSHRSDHSDPVGDTFIWCPSLVPSGALRVALSIHDSRRHLVVHPKRILVLTHGWVNMDETNGWFKLI